MRFMAMAYYDVKYKGYKWPAPKTAATKARLNAIKLRKSYGNAWYTTNDIGYFSLLS